MENIPDKSDSTAGANGELPASQYNDHKNEIQGAVEASGQTLSAATTFQFAKSLFTNGAGAQSVIDSGSGDLITLSPLTGASGLRVPDNYSEINGVILRFNKTTPNASTSVSVNFGQTGTELTAKTLVRTDGSTPGIGDVYGECAIRWDNLTDKWILISNGGDTFLEAVADTDTYTPVFEKAQLVCDTIAGDSSVTIEDGSFLNQEITLSNQGTGIAVYTHPDFSYGIVVDVDHHPVIKWISDGTGGMKWSVGSQITVDDDSGQLSTKLFSDNRVEYDYYMTEALTSTVEIDVALPYPITSRGVVTASGYGYTNGTNISTALTKVACKLDPSTASNVDSGSVIRLEISGTNGFNKSGGFSAKGKY